MCEKTECNRKCLEEFSAAVDEIDNGKLEIEGYERVAWTKLDLNDPKTFPPKWWFLGCINRVVVRLRREESDEAFVMNPIVRQYLTHWRPLPKPPTETEEAK
ncbi:MAG: hypothetical protein IKW49_01620 [Opitutales bacterium]|nr:hypothetical protein [Opitutales bacterium]